MQNLKSRIRAIFTIEPSRGAIAYQGRWISWSETAALMQQLASALDQMAPAPGAAVGVVLRNRPAHVATLLEILLSGRCLVTINPFQAPGKLSADVQALRCPVLIADAEDWPAIAEAAQGAGSAGLVIGDDGQELWLKTQPGLDRSGTGDHRAAMPGIAVEMLTSGTTGPAKRIKLAYSNFERALLDALFYEADGQQLRLRNAVAFASQPLVHIGGIWAVASAFIAGRAIVLFEKFSVRDWQEAVKRHRPKLVPLVPTAIKMVCDADVPREDLASLIAVRSGTAPLDPELQEQFESHYGIPILNSYGATEFAGGVAGWTLKDHRQFSAAKRGSVGRAQPGCELRIVDREDGHILDAGEVGLLEVRAKHVGTGDWVRTTDLAEIDTEGFLFIRGRADDAIIRGGFKILPQDVAKVFLQHPSVKDAAVVGIRDERLGAVPVAAVELRDDQPRPTEDELLRFARQSLVTYQVPVALRIVDALPRTPSLKVSQPAVRALFETPAGQH